MATEPTLEPVPELLEYVRSQVQHGAPPDAPPRRVVHVFRNKATGRESTTCTEARGCAPVWMKTFRNGRTLELYHAKTDLVYLAALGAVPKPLRLMRLVRDHMAKRKGAVSDE